MNDEVNLLASTVQGETIFEVLVEVAPGVELVAFFDKRDGTPPSLPILALQRSVNFLQYRNGMGSILEGKTVIKFIFHSILLVENIHWD